MNQLDRKDLSDRQLVELIAEDIRSSVEGRCIVHEPLSGHTSFRVGGPAALYVYPAGIEALSSLLQFCRDRSLNTLIIGYGNNLLVSDAGFAGCVIDLMETTSHSERSEESPFKYIAVEGERITAGAGVWLNDLIMQTADNGLTGMEELAGIPGGIGGGMSMNCGAFGRFISDHLEELKIMELDGEIKTVTGSKIEFGYRIAPGLKNRIVLEAAFDLQREKAEIVNRVIAETIAEREKRNIMTLPSAGSVFRNPEGYYAARLLDSVGARGMKSGGVEVSSLHANFIVNSGNGTAADIMNLILRLKEKVYTKYNLELKLELRTIGF
ncbi:UDP-N-acetylmuramate dehydrogenase [bacterium]|nr:UDP-N-acetylmuramate dehydrogenase [bacterium]